MPTHLGLSVSFARATASPGGFSWWFRVVSRGETRHCWKRAMRHAAKLGRHLPSPWCMNKIHWGMRPRWMIISKVFFHRLELTSPHKKNTNNSSFQKKQRWGGRMLNSDWFGSVATPVAFDRGRWGVGPGPGRVRHLRVHDAW